ncbi:MAG: DUF255 domain-containing protein [Candidatus Kapabacteria bacterium]|nr:DUF255 domain-containing protein [Candidatus Kapabacteria bacterium]
MKNYISIFLLVGILSFYNSSISEELKFETGSWENVKALAQKSNKIIFLDAYTDWCGWCKVLDKETFTNKEVIDFINLNFIPVKYEMETGFGKILAMKYRVRGFPSQLFFSPDGKLIYTSSGYKPPKQFIEMLSKTLDKKNHSNLKGISDKLEPGFPDLYKSAFGKNSSPEKKYPTSEQVVTFLESRENLFDEISWSVLSSFPSNEKYDNIFLNNIDKYKELYGVFSAMEKFYDIIYSKIEIAIKEKSDVLLQESFVMIDKYDIETPEKNKDFYAAMYYDETQNFIGFSNFIDEKIKSNKLSDEKINDYCWNLYEKCNEPEVLQKAVIWIKPIIEKSPNYMNLDTYAALLYKTKNYSDAKIYAEKAIEMGIKDKENVKSTEELLEKIKLEIK